MKRCPQCNHDYFDNMLEFCLEDGSKLFTVSNRDDGKATIVNPANPATAKTLSFQETAPLANEPGKTAKRSTVAAFAENLVKPETKNKGYKMLEPVPLIIALAHNWWQWIYVNNQSYSSPTSFLISANFIMWLFLLIAGIALGLFAVKNCQKKGFAYTGLVIIAINLILFLVPRR